MGAVIPQVITETKASGAQVIEGSLKFDGSGPTYLKRTFSAGNQRTWTWSAWVKRDIFGERHNLFGVPNTDANGHYIEFRDTDRFQLEDYHSNLDFIRTLNQVSRDTGWFHWVVVQDTTQSTDNDKIRIYKNGVLQTDTSALTHPSTNEQGAISRAAEHRIGVFPTNLTAANFDGSMSQVYFVDGQALGPEEFGFTDPLTNTWRPKRFSGSFALGDVSSFSLADNDFTWSGLRSTSGNDPDSGVLTDGTLDYGQTFWGNSGANGSYLDIDMTGASAGETFLIRYWNAAEASGQTITATCKQVDSGGSDISGTAVSQTWNQGQKWNDGSGYITQTIQSNTSKIRLIFSGNNNNSYGWGIGEVEMEQVLANQNSFYLPMDGNSPIGKDMSGRGNDWTPVNFGGSVELDKATGALPILNTTQGGTQASVGVRTDAYYNDLVLATPLFGIDDDVSNQINSGSTKKVMTNLGNVAPSSAQSNFYGGSYVFDNASDKITTPNSSDWQFGTGDFTVECWYYMNNTSSSQVFVENWQSPNTGWQIYHRSSDSKIVWYANTAAKVATDVPGIANKWTHVAVCRTNGTTKIYLDGVEHGSASDTINYLTSTVLCIGSQQSTDTNHMDGYLQDVRVYKGVAKYTSNFIPVSTNPDILPDTPSGVSGSSKLARITDGAVTFDGDNDYLQVHDSDDFNVGTGDFTLECFINSEDTSDFQGVFGAYDYENAPILQINNAGLLRFTNSGGIIDVTGTTDLQGTGWHHIVMCRSGTTLRGFVDGRQEISTTYSNAIDWGTDSTGVVIGTVDRNDYPGQYEFKGQISNLRLVKGTALYTSDFIPPTEPLTNVTNTKLLCCQSNTSAGGAVVSPNLTAAINDGTVWSDFLSSSGGFGTTHVRVGAFDGNTDTMAATAANTGYAVTGNDTNALEFIPPSPIAYSSSIKVRGRNTGQTTMGVKIDTGSGYGSEISLSSDNLQTVVSGSGNLVKIKVYTKTFSGENELGGIAIDDVYLTDPVTVYGDASATNFNPFNTDINTVRGQETNYCVVNPLTKTSGTVSNGNLKYSVAADAAARGNIHATTGKYYMEVDITDVGNPYFGIGSGQPSKTGNNYIAPNAICVNNGGDIYVQTSSQTYPGKSTMLNQVGTYMCAVDVDSKKIWWGRNGQWHRFDASTQNLPSSTSRIEKGLDSTDFSTLDDSNGFTFHFGNSTTNTTIYDNINFGQKPFKFPPPTGFQPLNGSTVRPETVIARPDQYVGVKTYTGNGSNQSIKTGFQPDLVWAKSTDTGTTPHLWVDSVRGVNKSLSSHTTGAEEDYTSVNGVISSFNRDGFDTGANQDIATNGRKFVTWNWKAGGNKNTFNVDDVGYSSAAAAGLSGGTITPSGSSVGTKQGFSIIKYTGNGSAATIPHGLSQTPTFIIKKFVSATSNWDVWTPFLSANNRLLLNTSDPQSSTTSYQSVNATTFDVHAGNNDNNVNMIAYLWHNVPGLQKFGSYTGNGTADDGPFVELGFRPAVILIKRITSGSGGFNWTINDSERNEYNPSGTALFANLANQESTSDEYEIDFLSNGFKPRCTTPDSINVSGQTYIYAAWAEAPTFNLYGAQSNAR